MVFKQLLFSSAIVAALALSSCSETESTKNTATEQAETDAILMNTSPAMPGASSAQSATVLSSPAGQAQTATQGSTQAAKTVAALNPAHGQPGHRCDIEVGAPLNSPAGAKPQAAAPQVQQQPVAMPAPASSPAAKGSGRVNPAHGQPGHDCAVAVGAPLP
jgi:hypothetical protein